MTTTENRPQYPPDTPGYAVCNCDERCSPWLIPDDCPTATFQPMNPTAAVVAVTPPVATAPIAAPVAKAPAVAPSPLTVVRPVTPDKRPALDTDAPILPEWLREWPAFRQTAARTLKRTRYRVLRWLAYAIPVLWWLGIVYPWRGAARVVAWVSKYLYDYDSATMQHAHAGSMETPEYLKVQSVRRAKLKARWLVTTTAGVALVGPALAWFAPTVFAYVAAVWLFVTIVKLIPGKSWQEIAGAFILSAVVWWFLPGWLAMIPRPPVWPFVTAGVAAWLALGWYGRPDGYKPGTNSRFTEPAALEVPKPELVIDALIASVPGITERQRDQFRVHAPGVGRGASGYHLSMELPGNTTVSDVMENRETFAGALRRQLGCVWPSKGHMHPGHLKLFIGDEPMAQAEQSRWPLADGKRVSIFDRLPLFTDQEGRWFDQMLAYKAMVVGGMPGYGKSFFIRELGCAVGLDPTVKVKCYDGKGNGDLRPLRLIADEFHEGDEPDEIKAQLASVKAVREEMRRRARFLRDLPSEENPEDKVTAALVAKYPHLAPIVLLFDEVQVYTEHEDKDNVREPFIAALADIVRRGRSAGIIPIFCTQKPSATVIPTVITDNCSVRVCFRVNGQKANDAVLGSEMHSTGIKATKFGPDDAGLAWLKGDGAEPLVVRTAYGTDKPFAEKLMRKARAMREALGLLTGYAAGEEAEEEEAQVDLLADARDIMDNLDGGRKAMHLRELLDALSSHRDAWGHLDVDALGSMLRVAGVRIGTVWSSAAKRDGKGVKREWLDVAATSDEDPDAEVVDLTERLGT